MSTVIQIKRSTGVSAPTVSNLAEGELAYVQDRSNSGAGAKLYIESVDSDNSTALIHAIGGKYYTDLIRYNKPGEVREGRNADTGRLSNGFIPVMNRESAGNPGGAGNIANMPRVDFWGVDQLTFDDNVISTNATDTDLILRTNGTGTVNDVNINDG